MTSRPSKPTDAPTRPFPYRVINTRSLKFTDNPKKFGRKGGYATLSHTWVPDIKEGNKTVPGEIIYKEAKILFGEQKEETQTPEELRRKKPLGTSKLLNAIHAAKKMGHRFLWIDTCCINKDKDADETDVSIPSMGDWYINAHVCLVFLEDLDKSRSEVFELRKPTKDWTQYFIPPRWATRGWTLQEIALSQRAVFFNANWKKVFEFDRKKPPSLELLETARILYKLCRVPEALICNGAKPDVPSNMILDLAATRDTTKPVDRVYSLMGLFSVKMQLVSGEGFEEAFKRLCWHISQDVRHASITGYDWKKKTIFSEDISTSREFCVYPIDRLTFPQSTSRIYSTMKAVGIFSNNKRFCRINSFDVLRMNCQLVWNHGTVINLDIACRIQSLLLLFGGKTEWVLLRSKRKGFSADHWELAEITKEKRSSAGSDKPEIFASQISLFSNLSELSDTRKASLFGELPHSGMTQSDVYFSNLYYLKSMSWEEFEMHTENYGRFCWTCWGR